MRISLCGTKEFAVVATLAILLAAPPAAAAGPMVLRISHQWPAQTDFRDKMVRAFAKDVEKRTSGGLKFQIYPSGSLFAPHQQFDALASGALEMAVYPLTYSGGKLPAVNLTNMPGLVKSYEQAARWQSADIGKWLEGYLDEQGVKIVSWNWLNGGVVSRGEKPLLLPDDIKGLRGRGPGKMMELLLQAAGASIASFPSTETYNALQSGIVDALWAPSSSLISFRLQEVSKHVTSAQDHSIGFVFVPFLMSKATYEKKLTPKQQKIVMDAGRTAQTLAMEASKRDDDRLAEVYRKAGVKVSTMGEQAFMAWKKLAQQSAWKQFAKQVKDGQKLLEMADAVKADGM